ncbi:MAG: hypothetical protein L6R41_002671 [Letrouitia leprolyta]|nr:MAG: hypothetical protein L6R41_002671 [Letrouitia leprolyta]
MAAVGAKKPFEESLEDLETLVDIYSRYPSDRLEYAEHGNTSILIERAIIAMQSASPDYLQSHRTLESSNRISSVISKLKKCDSEANFDGLSQLLKELLGSTRLASDRAMNIAAKPTNVDIDKKIHNCNCKQSVTITSDDGLVEDEPWEMTLKMATRVFSRHRGIRTVRNPTLKFDATSKSLMLMSTQGELK